MRQAAIVPFKEVGQQRLLADAGLQQAPDDLAHLRGLGFRV